MMRSLGFKLTLAFLVVGLVGSVSVAVLAQVQTRREFNRFVLELYESELVEQITDYYVQNGSWGGLREQPFIRRGGQGPGGPGRAPLIILDAEGRVVLGPNQSLGERLPVDPRQSVPLIVQGQTVGWLVVPLGPGTPSAEVAFINRLNQIAALSGAAAVGLALIVGVVLARAVAQPVKALQAATERVAGGELGFQVPVRTRDELGQLAQSFNQMSADLARSHQLRRQMTADIAHELRTPLSVILGYTEALSDGKLSADPAVFRVMDEEARHLQRLIDDLRTLSLADAGELPLMRQPTQAAALLERAAAAHAPLALQREVALQVQAAENLPELHIDADRMAQVLNNLVANALRYTPAGGHISLSAAASPPGVLFTIRDTGPGIPTEEMPFIFERFYRGDQARQRSAGESGLGLAIARSIVEAHGGSITAESSPGQGAAFFVRLPLT